FPFPDRFFHPRRSFFLNATPTPELYTLSLHDALPISHHSRRPRQKRRKKRDVGLAACFISRLRGRRRSSLRPTAWQRRVIHEAQDRKSTRLNSSHQIISYAVFCLKKKKNTHKHGDHRI